MVFTKLKIDDGQVVDEELTEPFDEIVPAGRRHEHARPIAGTVAPSSQRERDAPWTEGASLSGRLTVPDLLAIPVGAGSSRAGVVPPTGFEPAPPA
jgi:hypothetical protein